MQRGTNTFDAALAPSAVLLGFAGVLDVGYALNFAIGAYLMAYLTGPAMAWRDQLLGFVPDGVIVFAIIIIATGCLGMVKGWLTARMRIDYLAIATLALSLMMRDVLKNSGAGGVGGFSAIPPPTLLGIHFNSFTMQYLLVLGVVALRPGRPRGVRIAAWLAALAVFGYVVSVALTRSRTAAVTLSTGQVLVVGGLVTAQPGFKTDTWLYSALGGWSLSPAVAPPVSSPQVVPLTAGAAILIGGGLMGLALRRRSRC